MIITRALSFVLSSRIPLKRCITNQKLLRQYYYSMVCVTVPENNVAKELALNMLKKKMIACANISTPVTSLYIWKGDICEDSEVIMFLKTRTSRINDIISYVRENHPYDVCEVISFPISAGSEKYLDWIGEIVSES